MAFYAHPSELISPGDIFPDIPFSLCIPPLQVLRKSKFTPKAKFGAQDLRRVFTLPEENGQVPDLALTSKAGEQTIASTRRLRGIFLSWGSQVEADERETAASGQTKRKSWLAAPIFPLLDIPDNAVVEDPDTNEKLKIREIIRQNLSHNYFYLPPLPGSSADGEQYVDFRRISALGIGFFVTSKADRLATLTEDSLNLLFSRLMWFFTRAEYFFGPIQCRGCGQDVSVDVRFHGQNFEAEPWE